MRRGAKHKLCRRIGTCVWGSPKCPSTKRPYPAGSTAKTRRRKLSTYGELLLEKQKLRAHYQVGERQLRFVLKKSRAGTGQTGDKLLRNLEMRLTSVVYRSGLAPTIFAAKQVISHRHILVDGKIVNRGAYRVKAGQVISIDAQRSPSLAGIAQTTDVVVPSYLEMDKENIKATVVREPLIEEIPANVNIMRVVEYYSG